MLRQIEHHVLQNTLANGAKAARARAMLDRLVRDGAQRFGREHEFGILELEHAHVLLHQRVLRVGKNVHQVVFGKLVERANHRNAAHKFGNHAELVQVFGQHLFEKLCFGVLFRLRHIAREADALLAHTLADDIGQTNERAAQNEQDVRGIDMDELLLRVLATALWRNARLSTLDDLEQCLLNTLARHVARDGKVFSFAGDLVDLVDIDDADLSALDIEIGRGNELQQNILDVFAHVARFGKRGGVGDGKRNLQRARERLREQRFARTRGAQKHDVALSKLDVVVIRLGAEADTLVVVVYGNRKRALGGLLANNMLAQAIEKLMRRGQCGENFGR